MSRKASLDLSIKSIVFMVIVFVVLGLIFTFTRGIFGFGQQPPKYMVLVNPDLTEKPTSEKPVIPTSFILTTGQSGKQTYMGFYNNGSATVTVLSIQFDSCIGFYTNETRTLGNNQKPMLQMTPIASVEPNKSAVFTALVSNPTGTGLPDGYYLCVLKTDKNIGSAPLSVTVSVRVVDEKTFRTL